MRIPLIWVWRVLLGGFVVAYFASSSLQLWVPPLVPFVAAVAIEAQFFFAGSRGSRGRTVADRGPQPRDLEEFGWTLDPDEADFEPVEEPIVLRPRRTRRRLIQLAVVLVVLSGLFLLDRSRASWQKLPASERAATVAILDRQAARIAGHRAQVMCDTSGKRVGYVQEADGLAEVGGSRMWLTPGICYRLAKIKQVAPATETATGKAIAVFAHEAWHLHGVASESLANCYAYRSGVSVGQALGLSAGTARRLMRQQFADNPSDFADTPAYVVPHGCRSP